MTIKAKREIIKDVIQIMVDVDYNDNKTFIIALSKVNETYNKRIIPIEEVYEIYENDEELAASSGDGLCNDCCVQLRQDKEFERSIETSFLFGTAFGFASKYDEKDKILKNIREIIDGNGLTKQEPSETIHGSTYGGVSWSETYKPQQTSEDAISRQAVIEYIEGSEAELGHSSENELVCQDIKELPPVNPQPKTGTWIPVSSKRLPDEDETVIASTKYGVYPEAKYTKEYGWEWAYEAGADYWKAIKEDVVAWMPLPEKYEPESEEQA